MRALPLATADAIEWGTRRVDIFLLGLFAAPAAVGVYYIAQQVASLPQKLKTSFEPILGPVITKNLKTKNYQAIASQICQVGFWIVAMQAGIALALGVPGEAVMGLVGPEFVGGTGALAFLLVAEVVAATAVILPDCGLRDCGVTLSCNTRFLGGCFKLFPQFKGVYERFGFWSYG